ncbi:helix-turn-helix domain-containing protein [Shewanella glacialimarina]|uniref:helix-turn-helix domain-containing protein n=1 Tax=Shewanella glacialimarina TaxID=2590884 RepID=UPI001CF86A49|nr:helix-turn-helix domain-containing protein [Shewanella glacialimarina]
MTPSGDAVGDIVFNYYNGTYLLSYKVFGSILFPIFLLEHYLVHLKFLNHKFIDMKPESKFFIMKILKDLEQGCDQIDLSVKDIRIKYGVTSNVAKETFDYLVKYGYAIRKKPKNIKGQVGSNAWYKLTVDFFNFQDSSDEDLQFYECIETLMLPDLEIDGQRAHSLNQSLRLLLSILLSRANKLAIVDNVSMSELADLMGVSHRRVKSQISTLKTRGYIHFHLPGMVIPKLFGKVKSHYHLNLGKFMASKRILITQQYSSPFDVCQYFHIAAFKDPAQIKDHLDIIAERPEYGVILVDAFKVLRLAGIFNGQRSQSLLSAWRILINKHACANVEEYLKLGKFDYEAMKERVLTEFVSDKHPSDSRISSGNKYQLSLIQMTVYCVLFLAKSVIKYLEIKPDERKLNQTYSIIGFTGNQVVTEFYMESFCKTCDRLTT